MKFRKILAAAFSIVFLSGCSNSNTIYIGGILPLTGDYYFCGKEIKNGIDLAISKRPELLSKRIKFTVKNDESDHARNIDAYNKFAADGKTCAIFGGGNSILSEDIAAVSQKKPLPIIVPSASLKSVTAYGENIYRIAFTDDVQGVCMAKFALERLNFKTAAVLYDIDNNYSITLAKAFVDAFSRNGGKILIEQAHPASDNDFKVQLNKVKLIKPDVLFVPDYADHAILVTKQARDMGINSVILGSDTWEEAISQSSDKSILEGIYFCSHYSADNPDLIVQNFVSEYKKKYEIGPSSFAVLGFDSANIFFDAVKKAKSTDMQTILKAMAKTNYSGVSGKITFDKNRNPVKNLTILKISNGKNNFFEVFDSLKSN